MAGIVWCVIEDLMLSRRLNIDLFEVQIQLEPNLNQMLICIWGFISLDKFLTI